MKKHTWKEKFQYRFDNLMSKGTVSLIGMLFGITVLVVCVSGILVAITRCGDADTVGRNIWISLMHAIDAGTITADDGNLVFMILMTIVTICGLFITSVLIGVLNTGIENKMTSLQKGKSLVLEKNHVIILGFNENALNIISELIIANENHKHQRIVIMDDVDKTEMEDAVHQKIPNTRTTKIICRSGRIDRFSDLSICSPETCRSIIVNVNDDAQAIKTLLACVSLLEKSDNSSAYITAMIQNPENLEAARIAGGNRAEILYVKNTIARLMAHVSRQPGISSVFTNLLSYDGDEIYVEPLAGAEGHTVEELNLRLPKSIVIGISKQGIPKINPPGDTRVEPGDEVILIEEDDGVSSLAGTAADVQDSAFSDTPDIPILPQHTLILGCGEMLELALKELDNYVAPGSGILIADTSLDEQGKAIRKMKFRNMTVELKECDIYTGKVLNELLQANPQNVMIMTDTSLDDDEADARTLLLLLQLDNLAKLNHLKFTVASEMRKVDNQELARLTKVNDFVVSNNIVALMMTQISQNRQQRALLEDLLDEDGSEFYRKPISRYVKCGIPVDFYTVTSAAARYGEVAVGYQKAKDGRFITTCNPEKAGRITFAPEDALIVIAED